MNGPVVTLKVLKTAHKSYEEIAPRDLFYRAATELLILAIQGAVSLKTSESLAVLLKTWNSPYYKNHAFDEQHFSEIERLLHRYKAKLSGFRERLLESFPRGRDKEDIKGIFGAFEEVFGRIGAAKALHLLAPKFFPLWDTKIINLYPLTKLTNAENYCEFMKITKRQVKSLGGEEAIGRNPLKALDEWNYCKVQRYLKK
jgi:hypothetical protein